MVIPTPTADEYDEFALSLPSKVSPPVFLQHLQALVQLESRLNYRFLELEAKLRFLRLLTAGTETPTVSDNDLDNSREKLDLLNTQIDSLKKQGKTLRRKLEKCIHHPDVKRCIEGKPVLEQEIQDLQSEIQDLNTHFNSLGLPSDLTFPSLSTLQTQCDQLNSQFTSLQNQIDNIQFDETTLDNDITELNALKAKLQDNLTTLTANSKDNIDSDTQRKFQNLNNLIELWQQF